MWYRSEQKILSRRISNSQKTFKKLLSFLVFSRLLIKTQRHDLTTVRMAKVKNTEGSLCWRRHGVRRILLQYWCLWYCKHVLLLWKSVW